MTNRVVLGGIREGGKLLQLVDEPFGLDAVLTPEFVRLEVTGGRIDLSLSQLRRFKETIVYAERILVARKEKVALADNLSLPL